mmetsp:Transcript_9327/g.16848  ORF Transcript_9327/g.16848 Transcript_9327/m.16848 type:complete len:143 (-) Transcript_9327:73-501(-)
MLLSHRMCGILVDSSSQPFVRLRRSLTDLRAIAGMAVRGVNHPEGGAERAQGVETVAAAAGAQTPDLGVAEEGVVEVDDAPEALVESATRAKHAKASVTTALSPAGECSTLCTPAAGWRNGQCSQKATHSIIAAVLSMEALR